MWRGGAFNLGVLMLWGLTTSGRTMQEIDRLDWIEAFRTLPLTEAAATASQDIGALAVVAGPPTPDDAWADGQLVPMSGLDVPALVMGGWYDLYAADMFTAWAELRASDSAAAAGSAGSSSGRGRTPSRESTVTGRAGLRSAITCSTSRAWSSAGSTAGCAASNGVDARAAGAVVRHGLERVAGRAASGRCARTDWQAWHLHSGGGGRTRCMGDGALSRDGAAADEPADTFVYDPDYPVPDDGRRELLLADVVPWGPYDQRRRGDARRRAGATPATPLIADLEVTGPVRVVLWAATDGRDTDWTAKLVDVCAERSRDQPV